MQICDRHSLHDIDAAGRVTQIPPTGNNENKYYKYTFDAAGRLIENNSYTSGQSQNPLQNSLAYDGDEQVTQRKQTQFSGSTPTEKSNFYFIRSSVLGQTVTEIDKNARKCQTDEGTIISHKRWSKSKTPEAGKFKPDGVKNLDGSVDTKASQRNQEEVLKKCKTEISGVAEPDQ